MKRGELYRVENKHTDDPRRHRVYVIVSRQFLVDSPHSTVVCAPIFSHSRRFWWGSRRVSRTRVAFTATTLRESKKAA